MHAPAVGPAESLPRPRSVATQRVSMVAMAVAIGILIALFVLPTTRWILWKQSGFQVRSAGELSASLRDLGLHDNGAEPPVVPSMTPQEAAERYAPDDFQIQLAAAVQQHFLPGSKASGGGVQPGGRSAGDEIRRLEGKFGSVTSLYANAVRMDCLYRIVLVRPREEQVLSPGSRTAGSASIYRYKTTPAQLAQFLRDCEAGERLEPGNGYFPMLRAAGLLIANRDGEALAELHKASQLTAWQPHSIDEADGLWRLNMVAHGDRSAIHRMAVQASVMSPEYLLLRVTARVATAKAILAERAGRRDEGLRIRMDVARCGALMRSEAPSIIGTMDGIAITDMVVSHPGGAAEVTAAAASAARTGSALGGARVRTTPAMQQNAFISYLRSIGARREASWYRNEIAAGVAARTASVSGITNSPAGLGAVRDLALLWLGGIALFGNAFWLLVLGVAGALYMRRWRARQAAGWEREDMFVVLMGAACILIATALIAWNQGQTAYEYAQAVAAVGGLYGGPSVRLPSDPGPARALSASVVLVLPAILVALTLIVPAVRRRPIILGMACSLRAIGPIGAALLMAVYAVTVTRTARAEAEMNKALSGIVRHEGRFMAQAVGVVWPPLKHE